MLIVMILKKRTFLMTFPRKWAGLIFSRGIYPVSRNAYAMNQRSIGIKHNRKDRSLAGTDIFFHGRLYSITLRLDLYGNLFSRAQQRQVQASRRVIPIKQQKAKIKASKKSKPKEHTVTIIASGDMSSLCLVRQCF